MQSTKRTGPRNDTLRGSGQLRKVAAARGFLPALSQSQVLRLEQARAAERWATWGAARNGARIVLATHQKWGLLAGVSVVLVLLTLNVHAAVILFLALATMLYFATGVHKLWLLARGEQANTMRSGGI
jgi:hypothetical protein